MTRYYLDLYDTYTSESRLKQVYNYLKKNLTIADISGTVFGAIGLLMMI